jgi:hypothetical protein
LLFTLPSMILSTAKTVTWDCNTQWKMRVNAEGLFAKIRIGVDTSPTKWMVLWLVVCRGKEGSFQRLLQKIKLKVKEKGKRNKSKLEKNR